MALREALAPSVLLPAISTRRLHSLLKARVPLRPTSSGDRLTGGNLLHCVTSSFSSQSIFSAALRMRRVYNQETWAVKASKSGNLPSEGNEVVNEMLDEWDAESSTPALSLLAKLAIALGIAATVTLGSFCLTCSSSGSSFSLPLYIAGSSQSDAASSTVGFAFTFFRYKIIIPEFTPGWVYFWLLMAAGCGLFISEEALNVWVGISLARNLIWDGNYQSLVASLSRNASYIVSTVLWVYWGVCISDMIPFYLGRLFRQTKASEDICSKLGIGKAKAFEICRAVQKYGNLMGFVERLSVGARNPTAFLAGASGISAECFFAGVCCGGLITLPIQLHQSACLSSAIGWHKHCVFTPAHLPLSQLFELAVGFLLRERPMVGLASVATVVGIWTVFPYLLAALRSLFLYIRQRH